MIEYENKKLIFNIKEIWFSDSIYETHGCSALLFKRCPHQLQHDGFTTNEQVTSVIDLTQDLDCLWTNMKKDSCRNSVRRALKTGIKIKQDQNWDEFHEIYKDHLSQKRYLRMPENKSIMMKYGTLFTAEYEGEVIGGHHYIFDQEHILYRTGATKIVEKNNPRRTLIGNASHLIHWEAIKYAKGKGIKEFDLGGLFTDSINAMKESFGGKRVLYHDYWKVYDPLFKVANSLGMGASSATRRLSEMRFRFQRKMQRSS